MPSPRRYDSAFEARGYHDLSTPLDIVMLENTKEMFRQADAQGYLIGRFEGLLARVRPTGTAVFLGDAQSDPEPYGGLDAAPKLEGFMRRFRDSPRIYALLGRRFISPDPLETTLLRSSPPARSPGAEAEVVGAGNLAFRLCDGVNRLPLSFAKYCFVAAARLALESLNTRAAVYINDAHRDVRVVTPELDTDWMSFRLAREELPMLDTRGEGGYGAVRHHVIEI